jgi:hypothetical protein
MALRSALTLQRSFSIIRSNIKRPSRYITYGLAAAIVLLTFCIILRPESLNVDNGLSYFGTLKTTIVPYTIAYLLYALSLWKVSTIRFGSLWQHRIFTWVFRIMIVQIIGLLLTPGNSVYDIHLFFGSGLFVLEVLLSTCLVAWLAFSWLNVSLVMAEIFSGIASFYFLPWTRGPLLQTQVLFQLAFGILLIRALTVLELKPLHR